MDTRISKGEGWTRRGTPACASRGSAKERALGGAPAAIIELAPAAPELGIGEIVATLNHGPRYPAVMGGRSLRGVRASERCVWLRPEVEP